jgi:hypothetical protein
MFTNILYKKWEYIKNANGLGNKFLQHKIKPFPEIDITEENTI